MPATDSDLSPLETETECTEFSATLPWYEASSHHCLICERFYPLGTFTGHVVETHGVSMVRYREQFPSDDLKEGINLTFYGKGEMWVRGKNVKRKGVIFIFFKKH